MTCKRKILFLIHTSYIKIHKCARDLFKYYLRTKENHYIHSTTIIYVKNTFLFFMKCLVQLLSHYLKNSRFLTSSNRYVKIPSKSRRELFNKTIADNILLWSKLKISHVLETKDSDYQLTGSTSGTPLATQNTPDGLPPSSLPTQQTNNHLQGLPAYSHNDYNNYPTLPVSTALKVSF